MSSGAPTIEAALLIAAKECDVLHVHEEGGENRGARVEEYLKSVGLGPGNPWCASFVSWCLKQAGCLAGPPTGRGAVRNWYRWANERGRLLQGGKAARRGMLFCYLNSNQTGHIGFVCETKKILGVWWFRTLEGNSNENGLREGTKVVRKWRMATTKFRFINLVGA